MNRTKNVIRPSYEDFSDDGSDVSVSGGSDHEMESISFGSLSAAQDKIMQQERKTTPKQTVEEVRAKLKQARRARKAQRAQEESEDDDDEFVERLSKKPKKGKNKHAPSESSAKKPVSRIRNIEGLGGKYKENGLYQDIRFDTAYGKADLAKVRRDYAFLDDYRQQEVEQMNKMLKDKKSANLLSNREREEIQHNLQSLQSRLNTLKNRDLESKILSDHKKAQMAKFKEGNSSSPYFLKKSEQRKLIQKARFEGMKSGQREKAMERKRKKRLGKEFREMEFNRG